MKTSFLQCGCTMEQTVQAFFFKKRKLLFDEVKSANDRLFYFRLLAANPLVCFVNEPLVNYMVNHNPQSLSNLQDERAWDDHLRGFAQIVGLFEDTFCVEWRLTYVFLTYITSI